MKSGLYCVPGVSAAARAAAWAKRLDWPDDEGVERVLAQQARHGGQTFCGVGGS